MPSDSRMPLERDLDAIADTLERAGHELMRVGTVAVAIECYAACFRIRHVTDPSRNADPALSDPRPDPRTHPEYWTE